MKKNLQAALAFMLLFVFANKATAATFPVNETHTNVTCFGGSDGAINISPAGGTAPYTYAWGDGNINQNRSGLSAGTYNLTVTDNSGNTGTTSITLTQGTPFVVTNTVSGENCGGDAIGAIQVSVSGSYPGYTYHWNDMDTTSNRSHLTAAVYYCTITDSHGCTTVDSANVTQPPGVAITLPGTDVSCTSLNNGAIGSTVQYGNPGYTYQWSTGATSQNISSLTQGTYTLTVTDTIGCTASKSATVGQIPGGMTINYTSSQPGCYNGTNGSITITSVVGSTGPYSYVWADGPVSQNRTGLAAGSYSVTATSSTGCTAMAAINISQPSQISVSLTPVAVTCPGGSNGAINTSVGLGTSPYSYNWGGGVVSQNRTGLSAGAYTITVTDAHGCTASASSTVTQPSPISITLTPGGVSCAGGPTGSITTSVTGGTSTYTYWWGAGVTAQNRTNLNAGTYTVTVTDAHGCTATASATVPGYTSMTINTTQVNDVCYGVNNGSVNVTVNNGWPSFSYVWSNGATTQNISGLAGGTYTVTVTDIHPCTATKTVTITQPSFPVTINASTTNINCNGGNNGAIGLTVSNGTSPYSYNWGGGITSQNRTGLGVGAYTVSVTDNVGCSASATYNITEPAAITVTTNDTNVTCYGGSNGAIGINVTGGYSPYTFAWNGGVTTQNRSNIVAGTYNLTVTDNHGCSTSISTSISQPTDITLTATPTNVSCNGGNNGIITTNVSGGAGGYLYNWSNSGTTATLTGLTAATYNLTVTDNAGCNKTTSATITQPAALSIAATTTNVSCYGGSTGSINLSVTGGASPYTYNWGGGITTQNMTNLISGSYTVTITDNAGCSATSNSIISQPSLLSVTANSTNTSCNGSANGSITLSVTGGTTAYSFNWGGGITSQNRTGLAAGNYTVTVTDNAGCTATNTTTITEPAALSVSTNITNVSCNGGNSGAINITITGGTTPFTYNWGGGVTTKNRSALYAGPYHVTVTDNAGCTTAANATVTEPAAISINPATVNVSCNGLADASITTAVAGGTGAYTYAWGSGATSTGLSGLAAGTYPLTVTDANTCTASVSIAITQPNVLSVNINTVNVACYGGSSGDITTNTIGGTTPYTFHWDNNVNSQNQNNVEAGIYNLTVTDANHCTTIGSANITQPTQININIAGIHNTSCYASSDGGIDINVNGGTGSYSYLWSNNTTLQNLQNVPAGNYTVVVTDANLCTSSTSVNIMHPTPVVITLTKTDASCTGAGNGSIISDVNGGNGVYSYNWSNGATTANITNLAPGAYTLIAKDYLNCSASQSISINQGSAIIVSATGTNVSCNGGNNGAVTLSLSGGATPYTFNWGGGVNTQNRTGLNAGSYSVTITDNNGCTASSSTTITQPSAINIASTVNNASCNGINNGSINITATGGAGTYSYYWGGGITSQNRSGLATGTYPLTITDANSCQATATYTITAPSAINVQLTSVAATCYGGSTGQVQSTVTGGSGGLGYLWSNGSTASGISSVPAGNYSVSVSDVNHCSASASTSVTQPNQIIVTPSVTGVSCNGGSNGAISLTTTGGSAGYSYHWGNGATTNQISGLSAMVYSYTVTDAHLCTVTGNSSVSEPAAITINAAHTDYACTNVKGSINLSVAGGAPPYVYNWADGANTASRNNLASGIYNVSITDSHSCTTTTSVAIGQVSPMLVNPNITDVTCYHGNNGAVNADVTGGAPPYRFAWNTGATTQLISNLAAATYSVSVIDQNTCQTNTSAVVKQGLPIQVSSTVSNVTCNGMANGAINLNTSGGAGGFNYHWSNQATSQNLSGIIAGAYTVTIQDMNNCSGTFGPVQVTQPGVLNISALATPVGCSGQTDGQVQVSASGGVSPYSYTWSNNATSQNITSLTAGSYSVTITDANHCT
ncbi:MAG TPA: SprB repeat-containing protein, partial [Chitinophagales bacterium]|nr:SprB repeat-containing protein [Chitinophagales bacterium]